MQTESIMPPAVKGRVAGSVAAREDELADFSTDRRVLLLSAMALAIGAIGSVVAYVLIWLIAAITNLAFYHRFSAAPAVPQGHHLGLWVVLVPVAGALVVGFMARFGSEKIRGHGIPEALEAILLGRSRIQPKVAILKPLSAAISIGTGGPFGAEGPIIMTGGAFGSMFAQRFHLSAAERKTLLVAGAAAGTVVVRMETAQLHSRGSGFDCCVGIAHAFARRGADLSREPPCAFVGRGIGNRRRARCSGRLWLRLVDDARLCL